MKAVQFAEYGGPEVMVVSEVERPSAGEGTLLVEVHGASLNPFDAKLRSGMMKAHIPLQLPITGGGDFSGVVKEVGAGVKGFAVGDQVYGSANVLSGGTGSLAEYAVAKADQVAKAPDGMDLAQAGGLPLVGASALQALTQHMMLHRGQKLLVQGGAGGIGHLAVQIGKHLGAHVATTVGTADVEFARELGADEMIDYKTGRFEDKVHDYDAVFDTVGGDVLERSLGVLKRGGVLVSMTGGTDEARAKELGVTVIAQGSRVTTAVLEELTNLVESGAVKLQVGAEYRLDQVPEAYVRLERGSVRGKVVVRVR